MDETVQHMSSRSGFTRTAVLLTTSIVVPAGNIWMILPGFNCVPPWRRGSLVYIIPCHRRKGWMLSPGGEDGNSRCRLERRQVRPDVPARSMVGFAVCSPCRIKRVFDLLHLGGVAGQPLHLWPLYLAFLFSRAVRLFAARTLRAQAVLVPRLSPLLSGASHPVDSRPFSAHLLLLPGCLLQV